MAERAYYQLRFVAASTGLQQTSCTLNMFTVTASAEKTINLASPPFSTFAKQLLAPDSHYHSQPIGAAMRNAQIPLFRYPSVRCHDGTNVGIFKLSAITSFRPMTESLYTFFVKNDVATLLPISSRGQAASFARTFFQVNGIFPIVT